MKGRNFTATILVDQSPEMVFNAVNNVRGWWSENIEGPTDRLGAEFIYNYKDVHISKMKIIAFVPGKKVEWLVVENHFNFTRDKSEWSGNRIVFEITDNGTQNKFNSPRRAWFPNTNVIWCARMHGQVTCRAV